jgi:hypothetical protein
MTHILLYIRLYMSGDIRVRRPGPSVSRGVYGFVLFLISKILFYFWITWIIVPQSVINYYGVDDILPRCALIIKGVRHPNLNCILK